MKNKTNKMKKRIIVLGKNGMLGRYVYKYFLNKGIDVIGTDRTILDASKDALNDLKIKLDNMKLINTDEVIVINCIGTIKPQVDKLGVKNAIKINSLFPYDLKDACDFLGYKLIHITTDCVYSGNNGNYKEDAEHDVTDIYGRTKSLGEPANTTVVRTSIIGEEVNQARSLVEWIKSNKDKKVFGYTNHSWNGITCLQFAKVCEYIIKNDLYWEGVKHVYSPNSVTKEELVNMISNIYELNIEVEPKEASSMCNRTLSTLNETDIDLTIPELSIQIQEMKDFYDKLSN